MATSQPLVHHGVAARPLGRRALAGVVGGLAGGVVFGMLMAMMGMLAIIASMVGSHSDWVGFGVHLVISAVYGLVLTLFFSRFLASYGRGALAGIAYGVLLWIVGPLLMMPLMLGMPVFTVDLTTAMSLMGHMVYGVVLALVAVWIVSARNGAQGRKGRS